MIIDAPFYLIPESYPAYCEIKKYLLSKNISFEEEELLFINTYYNKLRINHGTYRIPIAARLQHEVHCILYSFEITFKHIDYSTTIEIVKYSR